MFTQPSLTLPTVSTKNEARANQNDTNNKLSVADSLVLLQSLKQSRSKWLTKAFLRFSTRSKDKADQVNSVPPPHSLSLAGCCDLEIGPHLFPQTNIYFVQYQYRQPPPPAVTSTPAPPALVPPTPAPVAPHPPPITVSHELHAKVLAAASKDPELNHILQLASRGGASVIQLRALGTAIKAIEAGTYSGPTNAPSTSHASFTPVATGSRAGQPTQTQSAPAIRPVTVTATSVPPTQTPTSTHRSVPTPIVPPLSKPTSVSTSTLTPAAPPSIHVPTSTPSRVMAQPTIPTTAVLLEFTERPMDRWLLPTEYVLIDRRSNGDIHLSTFYPFDAYVPAGGAMRSKPAHPITMRFLGASNEIWNALSRTCTTLVPSNVQVILAEVITNVPPRTYLQYRIAPGALWEDIKTANPHAQSFQLPSKTPIPTTTRHRRTDSATGGSAPKKRKLDSGDTASKPKAKGKEKGEPAASVAPTPVPTNQPIVSNNAPPAPTGQPSAPPIPNAVGPISKVTTAPIPTNAPTSIPPGPLIDKLNTTSSCPSLETEANYSARVVQTSQPGGQTTISSIPAEPLYPLEHPALSQTSSPSQRQTLPPSQQAAQPPNQNTSVDLPGRSQ
ncbi:hypothetical protein ACGC1H_006766 [Rhizoctonia solani]|uniref:Uncharacterized protein n=1 Tax=Rhizoctonia solani TaxID=456999 RepID=A0A8H3AJ71_9AGAM|nr:unnamed protein product [Rhizoctonia solani]